MAINAKFGATVCVLAILCACGGAPAQPTTAPLVATATSAAKATAVPATPTATTQPKPTETPTSTPTPENFPATPDGVIDALKASKEFSVTKEPGFPTITLKYAGAEITYTLLTDQGTQPTAYVDGVTSEAMNTGLGLVKAGNQEAKDLANLSYAGTGLEKLREVVEVKFADRSKMLKAVEVAKKILDDDYEVKPYDSGMTGYGFLNRKDGKYVKFMIVAKNDKVPLASSSFFSDISNSMTRSTKDRFYGLSTAQICVGLGTYAKDLAFVDNQFNNIYPKYNYTITPGNCGIKAK